MGEAGEWLPMPRLEAPSGMPTSYVSVFGFGEVETEVRKSRFIGWAAPAPTEAEAQALIQRARDRYPDATHHCYAYHAGIAGSVVRFHDDGEPAGTAGRPILEVLERRAVRNAVVVVTRYFGGTMLGAAGLVRAYAEGASLALDAAGVGEVHLCFHLVIRIPYQYWGRVQHALLQSQWRHGAPEFGETVRVEAYAPVGEKAAEFLSHLSEISAGTLSVKTLGHAYMPLG